jgi:hypothetical protein
MSYRNTISVVVEGMSDEAVVRRLAEDHGLLVSQVLGRRGKPYLDEKFVAADWSWRRGAPRSESLARCARCLSAWR